MADLAKLFSKYLKEQDGKSHAVLSASGSERWLGCPGSIRESKGIPTVDSPASIRGTNTHTLLQFILDNADWRNLLQTVPGVHFRVKIGYDGAMLSNALFAAKFVWAEKEKLEKRTGKKAKLLTEAKLELKGVGFGTSDIILFQPYGELHVMDYKNGTKAVEPEGNTQGLYYSCAAADLFNWEFSELKITIIQPNASHKRGHIRTWVTDEINLERASVLLKRGAKATKHPEAPLVKNDSWCWFCPARPKCPLHMDGKEEKLFKRFQE